MPPQQLALDIGLSPEPGFDNFYPAGNEQAWQCLLEGAQQVVENALGTQPLPPVYLWGDTATGKSHLLQAAALKLENHGLRVGRLGSLTQVADNQPHTEFDEQWSAIFLDDVHLYDAQQQEIAFNWYVNAMHPSTGTPRWIISSGQWPATDLAIREDLRTRMGWGITWQLHSLNDEARKAVLCQQARARGLTLGDEVLNYLLTHFARDLRSLSALLAQLDAYALRTQRHITVPLLKSMLHAENEAP